MTQSFSRDGVVEDWPRPRGQNFVVLALALKTSGLGLDYAVLEHIPAYHIFHAQNYIVIQTSKYNTMKNEVTAAFKPAVIISGT